jgi:metal-responsive CopG/Arc/MetJ family transcriptional regulator
LLVATEMVRTHVLLPKDVVEEIDRRVGQRKRSEFLARAAQRELEAEDRLRAFDEFAGSLKDVDIPGWETSESAAEWVREQRTSWDDPWQRAAETKVAS